MSVFVSGRRVSSTPACLFSAQARGLFSYLQTAKGASVPAPRDLALFADAVGVERAKSPSVRGRGCFGGKTDIVVQVRDVKTSTVGVRGFSIKSQFAQAPTLFNAGTSSQMLFEMEGMDDESARTFNAFVDARGKREWAKCARFVADRGIDAIFIGCSAPGMARNLLFIRESMADVLAWMMKERLLVDPSCKSVVSLCRRLEEGDPLRVRVGGLYEKIVKDFLFAAFSGPTAARPWNGEEQVNGGYIVVLPDGGALCYRASDREQFRDYLFRHTFVEYVSCKKFRWGFVGKDDEGRFVLPLNASIRFFKQAGDAAAEGDGARG